jgi:hypothetical protein
MNVGTTVRRNLTVRSETFIAVLDLGTLTDGRPNMVRVINLRRMRWAWHVAHMGESRGVHRILVGKPEGKNHLEDPRVDGRIILRWIFRKWDVGA